jgi:DNA adenine methylase
MASKTPHVVPYQGSKRNLAERIAHFFPKGVKTMYEPFCGSAAMTIYAAHHRRADRFVIADSFGPIVELQRSIIERPEHTAERYREIWEGQKEGDAGYFNSIRDRYNEHRDPVDLLYCIARSVKNAVRFNKTGRYTQSPDKRRLGTKPDRMGKSIKEVSSLLNGMVEFRIGDWKETVTDAKPDDLIYMDPPYLGTSVGRDKRYHEQLELEALCGGLKMLNDMHTPWILSYDGMTGEKEYGPPLPDAIRATRLLLPAGRSSQSTLSGKSEETVESLYLSEGLTGWEHGSLINEVPGRPVQEALAL